MRHAVFLILTGLLGSSTTLAENAQMPSPETLAFPCMGCHGPGGRSAASSIPSIAGEEQDELREELLEFKAARNSLTIMDRIAKGYSDQELDALALYFSRQSEAEGDGDAQDESSERED